MILLIFFKNFHLNKLHRFSINKNKFYISLTLLIIILSVSGFLSYRHFAETSRKDKSTQLSTTALLKKHQIERWIIDKYSDLKLKSTQHYFRDDLVKLNDNHTKKFAINSLEENFSDEVNLGNAESIVLINRNGEIIASDNNFTQSGFHFHERDLLNDSNFRTGFLFDIIKDYDYTYLEMIVPVNDDFSVNEYFLAYRFNPQNYFNNMLYTDQIEYKSAETMIYKKFNDSIFSLNNPKKLSTDAEHYYLSDKNEDMPVIKAMDGMLGLIEGIDYGGDEVLAYFDIIEGTNWYIGVKVDVNELFETSNNYARIIIAITGLLVLFIIFFFLWIEQRQSKRLLHELYINEIKNAESNRIFRTTFLSLREGIIITNKEHRIIEVNPGAGEILGIKPENYNNVPIENIFNNYQDILNSKVRISKYNKNNKNLILEIDCRHISDSNNDLYGNVFIINDITFEKISRIQVEESEHKFKSLFNSSVQGIVLIDINTSKIISANNSFKVLFGYDDEEVKNLNLLNLHPEFTREFINPDILKLITNESFFEEMVPCLHRSGEIIYCNINTGILNINDNKYVAAFYIDMTDKRMTNKKLAESYERFSQIADNSSELIWEIDSSGYFKYVNQVCEKILGFKSEEIVGKMKYFDLHTPVLSDGSENSTIDLIKNKKQFKNIENCVKHKSGKNLTVLSSGFPIYDDYNKFIGYRGTDTDITNLIYTNEMLDRERTFFEQLFTYSPEGIVILDNSDRVINANLEFRKIFEYSHDELIGRYINDLIVPENYKDEGQLLTDSVAVGQVISIETVRRTKNGKLIDVSILGKPIIHKDGKQIAVYGIYRNISDRKIAEDALLESEKKNRAIVSAIPDIFFIIDNDFTFLECFTHDESLLFSSKDEFIGKKVSEIMPQRVNEIFEQSAKLLNKSKQLQVFEFQMQVNGNLNWFEDRLTKISDDKYLLIVRDITKRKQFEIELENAKNKAEESDRLKSSFLANMSHELRTPMSGIIGFTHLLKEPDLSDEEKNEFLELLERSNKRLLNLINDILDLSRIESGDIELASSEILFDTIINDIYALYLQNAVQKDLQFKAIVHPELKSLCITIDENRLYQILGNLVNNAIKFTHDGFVELGVRRNDDEIVFYIKDSGIGISSEFMPFLFDRFRQEDISFNRTYEGAGLGLSIVKGLVELLGGTIKVETEKNIGSLFELAFPAEKLKKCGKNVSSSIDSEAIREVRDLNKVDLKLLIVEDDFINAEYIKKTLDKFWNLNLLHTTDGEEAVEIFRDNPGIDLILMDVKLPSIDGIRATKAIRQLNSEVKIIAITAYAHTNDRERILDAGCDKYLTKPFTPDMLIETIKNLI